MRESAEDSDVLEGKTKGQVLPRRRGTVPSRAGDTDSGKYKLLSNSHISLVPKGARSRRGT